MQKFLKIIIKIFKNFVVDSKTKLLIKHNIQFFKDKKKYQKEFLIDYFESHEAEIARSYFTNVFREKYKCDLIVFGVNKNIILNYKWRKLYKSFNARKFKYIFFSIFYLKFFFDYKKKRLIKKFLNNIKNKKDILDFKYRDINIGRDIYDEYLYRYKQITLNVEDDRLKNVFYDFLYTIEYWINYFNKKRVIGISLSHPNVRLLGIIGKVASKHFNIPVYSVTNTYIKKNNKLDDHFKFINDDLIRLPLIFSKIKNEKKKDALDWSKRQLNKRLSGEVGVDMHYSSQSAFRSSILKRALKETNKIKVLICTHEFHDNPHSTGGLLFPDFYEWLLFLARKSINSKYEWYIKNHPDCDRWTKSVVDNFVKKFPSITLVNEQTSFLQLKNEGLNFVFTCHGTVGHECPLLDIQVVNADLNHPHIAYDFNWSPKNINEYEKIIDDLPNLKKKINFNEIYEFYYVRNNFETKNDLIFKSYKDSKNKQKNENINILDIFLEQVDQERHSQILKNISFYI